MMKLPRILDTTLRDGSYVLDFKFSAIDTAVIGGQLQKAGFELIEIGHGAGLGASEAGLGEAAESDETYLKTAAETFTTSKWGMFCIPGVAKLEHVDLAAKYGMNFIRVGTNVTEVEKSKQFIERAKHHGMEVFANFMKSYALEPVAFSEKVKISESYGAEAVYIVDSAGGMLTAELEAYIKAIKDVTEVPLGFHGHDNLGLSVGNAVRAWELGAAVIDTSLQGMGRGAGNTPTELFLSILERSGIDTGFNILQVMDIGEKYIQPLIQRVGHSSIDVVTGLAQFHSSYMGIIRESSNKFRIDPRKIIIELCKVDKINAPVELVEKIAQRLSDEREEIFTAQFRLDRYHGNEQTDPAILKKGAR